MLRRRVMDRVARAIHDGAGESGDRLEARRTVVVTDRLASTPPSGAHAHSGDPLAIAVRVAHAIAARESLLLAK